MVIKVYVLTKLEVDRLQEENRNNIIFSPIWDDTLGYCVEEDLFLDEDFQQHKQVFENFSNRDVMEININNDTFNDNQNDYNV